MPFSPESSSKLLIFKASKMHLFGEIMPDARYGDSLLVPSKIGSFLSVEYLRTFLSKYSFNIDNAFA